MAKNPTDIAVAAAALRRSDGRWLMQKRPLGKHHGGLWEFPGGKVEPGETDREALVRELDEELTIIARTGDMDLLATACEPAPMEGSRIVISLYKLATWGGDPRAETGSEIGWYSPEDISGLPVPPLDAVLARSLWDAA